MFVHDIASAPHLVSTMTDEQWLDALSCPRIDPIKQGKKVFKATKSDTESSNTDLSDIDSANERVDNNADEVQAVEKSPQSRRKIPDTSRPRRKR
jgi:hypothetical protein